MRQPPIVLNLIHYMVTLNGWQRNNMRFSFKVFAISPKDKKCVAEYLFAELQEAMKFELGMRKKGYETRIERSL